MKGRIEVKMQGNMKERKERKPYTPGKGKRQRILTGAVVAAFASALAIFGIMVSMERSALAKYEKREIYVVTEPIPQGMILTAENLFDHAELRSVDAGCVPESALASPDAIEGLISRYPIETGTLLTAGMFVSPEEGMRGLIDPVLVGFKAEDLYQVVGGILRPGDRVHIYAADEALGETALRWSDLFIANAFDASGSELTGSGSGGSRYNIYLSQADVEEFYQGMDSKNLRVVKICD